MREMQKHAAPATAKPQRAVSRRCPICGKPAVAACRPFCSQRCADIDLNRWLGGVYAIPVTTAAEDEPDMPAGNAGDE